MGFKVEQFVRSVDVNLFCTICLEVFEDPVSCKDGHTFCKDCIHEWLKKNRACPLDNIYLSKKNLVPQFTVKGIIDNLDVYCQPYTNYEPSEGGDFEEECDWVGKLQNLTQHRKTCPYQEVQCSHEKCTKVMERREIKYHEKICEFRKVECGICGMVLLHREKEKHISDSCMQAMIICPNRCIDKELIVMIKRADLDNHLRNGCPKAMVFCPFKDQGCSVQIERQDAEKHVQDNLAAHMMLLAKQCSSLTLQNASLAEQNTIVTEQCSELHMMYFTLVERNRQLQEELSQVKENCTYTWTINDFPTLSTKHANGSSFASPIFWLRGHRLNFLIYPNGLDKEAEGWLSLFLVLSEEYPKSRKIISKTPNINNATAVKFRLSVRSIEPSVADVSHEETHVFKEPGNWGWAEFMKKNEALDAVYCCSTNGSLIIQCTILPDKPQ